MDNKLNCIIHVHLLYHPIKSGCYSYLFTSFLERFGQQEIARAYFGERKTINRMKQKSVIKKQRNKFTIRTNEFSPFYSLRIH